MPTGPKGGKRPADAIGLAVKIARIATAMAAGIDSVVHDMDWVVGMIDAVAAKPNRPGVRISRRDTIDILNKGVTLAMADARKPRG